MFLTHTLWQGLGATWLSEKRELTCHDAVEEAHITNNKLCGAQAILLVYLTGVLLCQGLTIMANLIALIVYRSKRLQAHTIKLLLLSFVLPVAFIAYPWAKQSFGYVGYGSVCFMTSDLADSYFYYPIMIMMTIGVMLHFTTVVYMIKMYFQKSQDWTSMSGSALGRMGLLPSKHQAGASTAQDISKLLYQHWRQGAFVLCQLLIIWLYLAFYFTEAKKFERITPDSSWFPEWTSCLSQQAAVGIRNMAISSTNPLPMSTVLSPLFAQQLGEFTQRECQYLPAPFVPKFYKLVLMDIGPASFGIIIFVIFGSKSDLWQDWKEFVAQKIFRRPATDNFKIVHQDGFRAEPVSDRKDGKLFNEKNSVSSFFNAVSRPSPSHVRQGGRHFDPEMGRTSPGRDHSADQLEDDGYIPHRPPQSTTEKPSVKRSMSLQQRLLERTRSYANESGLYTAGVPRRSSTLRDRLPLDRLATLTRKQSGAKGSTYTPTSSQPLAPQPTHSDLHPIPETAQLTVTPSSTTASPQSAKSASQTVYQAGNVAETECARQVANDSEPSSLWSSSHSSSDTTLTMTADESQATNVPTEDERRRSRASRQARRAALEGMEGEEGQWDTLFLDYLNTSGLIAMASRRSSIRSTRSSRSSRPNSQQLTQEPPAVPPKNMQRPPSRLSS
ncbi:hypothetical protein BGW41_001514 [Actinomortierella wolfii]|nr:hypothetical protein BGW41_001514 [Actinomortierella wolfii]